VVLNSFDMDAMMEIPYFTKGPIGADRFLKKWAILTINKNIPHLKASSKSIHLTP
jgi:hypothetical protein